MTASEFAFLAMGLLLGITAGAALVEVLRARPPAAREVRVTVAQDAVPRRRAATLAEDAFAAVPPEPARGGPADRRLIDHAPPGGMGDRRTPVRSNGPTLRHAVPVIDRPGEPASSGLLSASFVTTRPGPPLEGGPRASHVAVPVAGGEDPMLAALRAGGSVVTGSARARPSVAATATAPATAPGATATAVLDRPAGERPAAVDPPRPTSRPVAQARPTGDPGADTASPSPAAAEAVDPADGPAPADDGPCADARRLAEERCELAGRARAQAAAAEDALRLAQRTYDDHEARAEEASRLADPRAVRAAKDTAQATFRAGRGGALTTEEVEAAARAWLTEINRINSAAREATAVTTREREAARALALDLERLALSADAARIHAETAAAACLAAREAVAACEEAATEALAAHQRAIPSGPPGLAVGLVDEPSPIGALAAGGTPRIFRLLRGERAAMGELVAALGGDDPAERRRWQLALSDLVDAILADAIEASALEFPDDHPFWGPFTLSQGRDITAALSSLGYRFDGLGGWVDGRVPSQRDLSLALGYAGLDPMRMRQWPNEGETGELFRDVTVAADEHLAGAAGDMTLGELVTMLGRRADGLAEVWNHWGRLRPLLLEEG